MAKCWTCGAPVTGFSFTCSSCRNIEELETLRTQVGSLGQSIESGLNQLAYVQEEAAEKIKNALSSGFVRLASVLEWGFTEVNWKLEQMSEALISIDHSLKNPSMIQANEWRKMAEELRSRNVFDEAEEFYLKALEINRLDYRIYVGLAETYLRLNEDQKAKHYLEKSLPHAPKDKIDYKSYSYRMIGHIYACDEDYKKASSVLLSSIELSPNYADGHYDYSQYCLQEGDLNSCLSSLKRAISLKPHYWYLAQKEQNFHVFQDEIKQLLEELKPLEINKAQNDITIAEKEINKAKVTLSKMEAETKGDISEAEEEFRELKEKELAGLRRQFEDLCAQYRKTYDEKENALSSLRNILQSNDYISALKIQRNAKSIFSEAKSVEEELKQKINSISITLTDKAFGFRERLAKIRAEKKKNIQIMTLRYAFWGWLLFGFGGCLVKVVSTKGMDPWGPFKAYINEGIIGLLLGSLIGFLVGGEKD